MREEEGGGRKGNEGGGGDEGGWGGETPTHPGDNASTVQRKNGCIISHFLLDNAEEGRRRRENT